jgi:hypothetical protein
MAITSWTDENMDWDNPNPKEAKYAEAINRAIIERANLVGHDVPLALKIDLPGRYISTIWKSAVDATIATIAPHYIVPIYDTTKYTITHSLSESGQDYSFTRIKRNDGSVLKNVIEGSMHYSTITLLNTNDKYIVSDYSYGQPRPFYMRPTRAYYYDLNDLMYHIGDSEVISSSSYDDMEWCKQRKKMIDALIYFPDNASGTGNKQDSFYMYGPTAYEYASNERRLYTKYIEKNHSCITSGGLTREYYENRSVVINQDGTATLTIESWYKLNGVIQCRDGPGEIVFNRNSPTAPSSYRLKYEYFGDSTSFETRDVQFVSSYIFNIRKRIQTDFNGGVSGIGIYGAYPCAYSSEYAPPNPQIIGHDEDGWTHVCDIQTAQEDETRPGWYTVDELDSTDIEVLIPEDYYETQELVSCAGGTFEVTVYNQDARLKIVGDEALPAAVNTAFPLSVGITMQNRVLSEGYTDISSQLQFKA